MKKARFFKNKKIKQFMKKNYIINIFNSQKSAYKIINLTLFFQNVQLTMKNLKKTMYYLEIFINS